MNPFFPQEMWVIFMSATRLNGKARTLNLKQHSPGVVPSEIALAVRRLKRRS